MTSAASFPTNSLPLNPVRRRGACLPPSAPYYDTTLQELVYPESDAHQVFLYDAIETQAVSEEFVNALFDPFVSCEWE